VRDNCVGNHPVDALERNSAKILWLLLGLALFIRLWGIGYGLPYVYWIDEYHEVMRAMELGAGEFNLSRTGKGGFYLLLFFEYGIYFVLLKLAGIISNAQDFAEQFVRDPTAFYLMGRATAAVFGCATVAAAYYVARKAYQTRAGLFAALFLAVNALHIDLSHRVGVDVPMTCFAILALYFGLRVATDGARRDYLLAGLCAALATTTKLPGILVLLPLAIAHTYRVAAMKRGSILWLTSREIWLAAAMFIVVLAVSNPGILLHFDYFSFYAPTRDEMLDNDVVMAGSFDTLSRPNLYFYYVKVLLDSLGWPLFGLAMYSVCYAAWRHRPSDVMLLSYAAINYLVFASTSSDVLYYPRYALPIIVVLAILAGRALADLTLLLARWRLVVSTALATALIVWPLTQAVAGTYLLTQTDTRTVAKEWCDTHVPAGSRVLIEGGKIAASRLTVPLEDSRESLERRIAYWRVKEPRQAKFLELKRKILAGGGYQLELVQIGSIEPLDDYIARGIKYFVVRPEYFVGGRKVKGDGARMLSSLRADPRARLLIRFDSESGARPGPIIEIYEVQPDAAQSG